MPYNALETFYNGILNEIINSENSDFMKEFYKESWRDAEFTCDSSDNVLWYIKDEKDKETILDEELDDYFRQI
jgi:hypothetical protein